MKRLIRASTLLILVLSVAGCRPASAPTLTSPPLVVTVLPTPTRTPTPTLTLVPLPTSTEVPELLPTSDIPPPLRQDIIFSGTSDTCQLPCWYGLRPGASDRKDVLRVFDEILDLDQPDELYDETMVFLTEDFPYELTLLGNWWGTEDPFVSVKILAWVSNSDDVLKTLSFYWEFTDSFDPITYPEYVLEKLGIPDQIWTYLSPTERSEFGNFIVVLFYDSGLAFRYDGLLALTYENTPDENEERFLELCAGADPASSFSAEVFLFDSLQEDTIHSGAYQEELLRSVIIAPQPFVTLEEALSMSASEFTQALLDDENGCLTASWPIPTQ